MRNKRVVITGMGIWSCMGQTLADVTQNLRLGKSGIVFDPKRSEFGLKCALVGDIPTPDLESLKNQRLTMSKDAQYAYMATKQALEDAHIDENYLRHNDIGIIMGNDGSMEGALESNDAMLSFGDPVMAGPCCFFKWVSSSASMNLSTIFHLRGLSFTIGAACSSSLHAVGVATTLIQSGLQDMMLVGGCADPSTNATVPAEALSVLSKNNANPTAASRPFDVSHDGFVPSGGAAMLVLEEYEHAVARGAKIYAEVAGYGYSTNDKDNISAPDAMGEFKSMSLALHHADVSIDEIDYISAHGTSTKNGDKEEALALSQLLNGLQIPIGATKSLTGHENWMSGASSVVYSLLMMEGSFVAPVKNLEVKIPEAETLFIPTQPLQKELNTVLVNAFGLGGTNGTIILKKCK